MHKSLTERQLQKSLASHIRPGNLRLGPFLFDHVVIYILLELKWAYHPDHFLCRFLTASNPTELELPHAVPLLGHHHYAPTKRQSIKICFLSIYYMPEPLVGMKDRPAYWERLAPTTLTPNLRNMTHLEKYQHGSS